MKNEQAIYLLKGMRGKAIQSESEALDMAIEALSNSQNQTDSEVKTTADSVSEADVIYRADAIDAVKKNTFRLTFAEEQNCEGHVAWSAEAVYSDVMEGALLELPSAQPEIVRCKDCKWWDKSEDSLFGYCMAMKHGYMSANWEIGIYRRYRDDFFCADGERGEADE